MDFDDETKYGYQPGDLLRIAVTGTLVIAVDSLKAWMTEPRFLGTLSEGDSVVFLGSLKTKNELLPYYNKVITRVGVGFVSNNTLIEHGLVDDDED